mgnify:CR=1 FL=1
MFKLWLTSSFGLGLLPKAPGTWGSLLPLLIALGCGHFGITSNWLLTFLICLAIANSIITVQCFSWYTKHFNASDPPQVVSDEVAGQSLALLGMAWLTPNDEVTNIIWITLACTSFMLFRILDITKVGLINKAQKMRNGVGVLMDDLVAGLVAAMIVAIISLIIIQ